MADDGERYTDKEFEKLKRLLERTYEQAGKELQEKLEKKLRISNKDLDKLYKRYQDALTKGDKKESKRLLTEYKEGLAKSMTEGNWYKEAVDLMAEELTHVNERALAYTQDRTPKVYEYNQKYTQNEVSKELAGYNFHLKDEQTVKNLTKRLTAKKLNLSKDKRWNSKKVNAQLLQGILQGESIPDIAKRIERVTGDVYKASLRTARTMMTGAQNEGRHDRATQLAQQGLLMKKVWIATGDDRVRTTHLDADGQEVELDEPFNVGGEELQYPADPVGSPAEVYNCRCKYSNRVVGFVDENGITHMFDIEHEEGLHQQQINAERERRKRLAEEKAKKAEAKQAGAKQDETNPIKNYQNLVKQNGLKDEYIYGAGEVVSKECEGIRQQAEERLKEKEKAIDESIANLRKEASSLSDKLYSTNSNLSGEEKHTIIVEVDRIAKEIRKLMGEQDNLRDKYRFDEYPKEVKRVLSKYRDMGIGNLDVNKHLVVLDKDAEKPMKWAYDMYPKTWVKSSFDYKELEVGVRDRGFYSHYWDELMLSGFSMEELKEAAMHELGHRFESVTKDILDAEKRFYEKRTKGEKLRWLGEGYRREEKTRKDTFVNKYMGKDYGGRGYELVSMGFEYAYTNPDELAKDKDMEKWIFGLLTLAE